MSKAKKLINDGVIVLGALSIIEGIFSFVTGLCIPFWELLIQVALSVAVIVVGAKRMVEL